MKNLIVFVCLFTFSLQSFAITSQCPEVFPKSQMISEKEMQKLLEKAKDDPSVKVERININSNQNWTIPDSSEEAAVVFAIIGALVIIAWIPYAITYLYDLSYGSNEYCPWYRLSLRYKTISSSSSEIDVERKASFTGLQLGVASLKEAYSFLGLVVEVGDHRIVDEINEEKSTYTGTYFMLGPSIHLGKPHQSTYTLDLLGGTSTNSEVTLMGEASINWNILLTSNPEKFAPSINLNFGANYLDIKETEGIIKNVDRYSIFWGFGFGIIF